MIHFEPSNHAPIEWQARDRFLAMLAHDLQTPLTAIILTASGELRHTDDAHRRAAALRVLRCAERMKRMTADLLDFARARYLGVVPVRPQSVDLAELVAGAVRSSRSAGDLDQHCHSTAAWKAHGENLDAGTRFQNSSHTSDKLRLLEGRRRERLWARDQGLRAFSRRRSGRRPSGRALMTSTPDVKALYKIAELCRFAGVSRYRLRRLLEQRGVKCITAGEAPYVPLAEIQERISELRRSLCLAMSSRRRDERSSRTTESFARAESFANRERYRAVRR